MSDQTTSANEKKIDKEKTVKKRAARSIVAPRIEEEGNHSIPQKKENAYIPGNPKPSKPVKKTVTVASPAPVHTEPGKTRTPRVISAPAGVMLNEDKMTVAAQKSRTVTPATGWPERPPQPRVPERNIKPEVKPPVRPLESIRPQIPGSKPSLLDTLANIDPDPVTPVQDKEVEQKLEESLKKVQEQTVENIKVEEADPGSTAPRKIVKTVVTTTTTTTYEPVTEEEYLKMTAQMQADNGTQTTVVREVYPQGTQVPQGTEIAKKPVQSTQYPQGTLYPQGTRQTNPSQASAPAQPAKQQNAQPGIIPEPVIDRSAVQGNVPPARPIQGTQVPQGTRPQQARPATQAPQHPQAVQQSGASIQHPQGTQPPGVAAAGQPVQNVQNPQKPVQYPQGTQGTKPPQQAPQPSTQQPQQGTQKSSIIGTMTATVPGKPMTAMDRQLAEIEKALGLAGDAPGQNTTVLNAGTGTSAQGPQGTQPVKTQPPLTSVIPANMDTKPVMDAQTKKTMEYLMLGVEALIFVVILCVCISIYQKIKNKDYAGGPDESTAYEENADTSNDLAEDSGTESFDVEQAGAGDELTANSDLGESDILEADSGNEESYASSDSVDVDNDDFSLQCTNITVTLDTNGNPAALIYFTFTNKTGSQLSMSEVFPPSVTQNGEACETTVSLEEYPEEFYNKDMQISDGASLNCCYAVALKDAVSPIRLTVYDNYETFADVGTTEIAIQ